MPAHIIFHCKYCGDCWQKCEPSIRKKDAIHYYIDFPSYGKTKKICPSCLGEYLKNTYERINNNMPITKYFVSIRNQKIVKWKCFIPTKKR